MMDQHRDGLTDAADSNSLEALARAAASPRKFHKVPSTIAPVGVQPSPSPQSSDWSEAIGFLGVGIAIATMFIARFPPTSDWAILPLATGMAISAFGLYRAFQKRPAASVWRTLVAVTLMHALFTGITFLNIDIVKNQRKWDRERQDRNERTVENIRRRESGLSLD